MKSPFSTTNKLASNEVVIGEQAARDAINEQIRLINNNKQYTAQGYAAITTILDGKVANLNLIVIDMLTDAIGCDNGSMVTAILNSKNVKDQDQTVKGQFKGAVKDVLKGGVQDIKQLMGKKSGKFEPVELNLTGVYKSLESDKNASKVKKAFENSGKLWKAPEKENSTSPSISPKIIQRALSAGNMAKGVLAAALPSVSSRLEAAIKTGNNDAVFEIVNDPDFSKEKLPFNPFEVAAKNLSNAQMGVINTLVKAPGFNEENLVAALKTEMASRSANKAFIQSCFLLGVSYGGHFFDVLNTAMENNNADNIRFALGVFTVEERQGYEGTDRISTLLKAAILQGKSKEIIHAILSPLTAKEREVLFSDSKRVMFYEIMETIISTPGMSKEERMSLLEKGLNYAVSSKDPKLFKSILTTPGLDAKERTALLNISVNDQPLEKWAKSNEYSDISDLLSSAKRYDKLENVAYKLLRKSQNTSTALEGVASTAFTPIKAAYDKDTSASKIIGEFLGIKSLKIRALRVHIPQEVLEHYSSAKIVTRDVYAEVNDNTQLVLNGKQIAVGNMNLSAVETKDASNLTNALYNKFNDDLLNVTSEQIKKSHPTAHISPALDAEFRSKAEVEKLIAKAIQDPKNAEQHLKNAKEVAFKDVREQYKEKIAEFAIVHGGASRV